MISKKKTFSEIRKAIFKAKTVAISGHMHPDGDSIGSMLGLGLALESLGKKVHMICGDEVPAIYRFLPGANLIKKTTRECVDLAIAVDCSTAELLGPNIAVFDRAGSILEIDHHEYRRPFGDVNFIDHKASSVGEMVYEILKTLGVKITVQVAEDLLVSIIVETNLFKLPVVRPITFRACADLVEAGADFYKLAGKTYLSKTKEAIMISAACMLRARFLDKGKLIWSVIKRSDLKKVKGKEYDADAVASEMLSIKGVKAAVLFREKDNKTLRVSLRSKGAIDVGILAEHYKGGGHSDIAGCFIPKNRKSMNELLSRVADLV